MSIELGFYWVQDGKNLKGKGPLVYGNFLSKDNKCSFFDLTDEERNEFVYDEKSYAVRLYKQYSKGDDLNLHLSAILNLLISKIDQLRGK